MKPERPKAFDDFITRFPELGRAWDELSRGALDAGPLPERTARLVKLAIAIGAQRRGAVRSAARKGRAAGLSLVEMEQAVALAASTIGLPQCVAAHGWIREALEP